MIHQIHSHHGLFPEDLVNSRPKMMVDSEDSSHFLPKMLNSCRNPTPKMVDFPEMLNFPWKCHAIRGSVFILRHPEVPWSSEGSQSGAKK